MGCCNMKAEVIYDETWDVPTDVEKTLEWLSDPENIKLYAPNAQETAFIKDKTEEHFYFNFSGQENGLEIYVHTMKKTASSYSYICDFPAVDPIASWKSAYKLTANPVTGGATVNRKLVNFKQHRMCMTPMASMISDSMVKERQAITRHLKELANQGLVDAKISTAGIEIILDKVEDQGRYMCCMFMMVICTLGIGFAVFFLSYSAQAVDCETIDLNNYSTLKYNIYKKAALSDTPDFVTEGNSVRIESSSKSGEFLHINDEDKLEVVSMPTRGITAEKIKEFESKSTFVVEQGLCLEPGSYSLKSKSKEGFYLSIENDVTIGLVQIDAATNGCIKWNACFIPQEEESEAFKDKSNPIVLESAIKPNFYLTYDGTSLSRSGKPNSKDENHEEKLAAWKKTQVWVLQDV